MRYALRRVLWLLPTLLVLSGIAFWLSSAAVGSRDPALTALPRFVNPNPRDCRSQALDAATRLEHGDSAAATDLVRLGGAALPHVLPRLDTLPPAPAARLARALIPIARRMALPGADEIDSPEAAVTFWRRFWQDRSTDFQPVVVKRLVRRLGERSLELRRDDVVELDTFAVEELIAALPRVRSADDVAQTARLTSVAAQIIGNDWTVDDHASVDDARAVVERWRRWWTAHHGDYATFDGPRRVVAMVTETQYGGWAVHALRERLGSTVEGRPVLGVLSDSAPTTLWLLGVGMVAGYVFGILLGLYAASTRRTTDVAVSAAALVLVALPPVALAGWLTERSAASGSPALAALVMVLASAALVSRHQRTWTLRRMNDESARTAEAYGASRRFVAFRTLRTSSVAAVSLVGVDVPVQLGTAFFLEHVFHLHGLGEVTWHAIAASDVTWLMTVGLVSAVVVAVMQILGDVVLSELNPQIRSILLGKRGVFR